MSANENIDYKAIAKEYGTPFYLIDKVKTISRVHEIEKRFPKNAKLCYAIKANAFLVAILKNEGILFEVCSAGELSICEKVGLNPSKIVFSGVVKTKEDVARAYNLGVHTITLESATHCEYLLETAKNKTHTQNVILRLTSGNQFGMSESDILLCIEKLQKNDSINIRGIHFFAGTQKKMKTIISEIAFIEEYCTRLQEKYGLQLEIEYGAGLPYDYFSGNDESDNFAVLEELVQLIKKSKFNYVIELGRYVASPLAFYATKIMDIKGDDKNCYCLIDGGINHINYFGQMMGMKTPRVFLESDTAKNDDAQDYTIAGSLCTTADIVLRKLSLPNPAINDVLIFQDIGAYSITEGIYLFLSHPLPAVLLNDNGTISVLRNRIETYILNS